RFPGQYLYMNGPELFNFTIESVPSLVAEVLEKHKVSMSDIDLFVFHQANKYMLDYLRKKIDIPAEKFHLHLESCGNTVSSTIPIAIYEAMKEGKVKNGDKVLVAGFGVGYSWGATIINF
ncbi:MAG: 3-oxoacyl-ACP synthase, partial [Sphingobacteriales bacterium]